MKVNSKRCPECDGKNRQHAPSCVRGNPTERPRLQRFGCVILGRGDSPDPAGGKGWTFTQHGEHVYRTAGDPEDLDAGGLPMGAHYVCSVQTFNRERRTTYAWVQDGKGALQ